VDDEEGEKVPPLIGSVK